MATEQCHARLQSLLNGRHLHFAWSTTLLVTVSFRPLFHEQSAEHCEAGARPSARLNPAPTFLPSGHYCSIGCQRNWFDP
jgi:hypothetical protein